MYKNIYNKEMYVNFNAIHFGKYLWDYCLQQL